jgi:NADH:ubiquinone oxidoreductase subunit 6 (subunit J)
MESGNAGGWRNQVGARIRAYPYSILGAVLGLALLVPFFRHDQDWVSVYMPAAERLRTGQDVFSNEFVYPPVNGLLPIPFLDLPRVPAKLAWLALNVIAFTVLVRGAWKLAGGGPLDGTPGVAGREHLIYWIGLGCGVCSCVDVITNEQTDLMIAALVIVGCSALVNGRDWRAGVWFGIAAGIKCTPLLFAPYLAWRKRWVAAGLVAAVAAAINVLPDVIYPPADGNLRVTRWVSRYLTPMTGETYDVGTWACGIGGNQSLAGFCQRVLIYDAEWNGEDLDVTTKPNRMDAQTLKVVVAGAVLVVLLVAVAFSWRGMRNRKGETNTETTSPLAIECGMVVALMVLFSPHSSKPHFCTLMLPGFCVARAALERGSRWMLAIALGAVMCAVVSNKDLVGSQVFAWAKWYASLAWSAMLLLAGSCLVLVQRKAADNAGAAPVEEPESNLRQAA